MNSSKIKFDPGVMYDPKLMDCIREVSSEQKPYYLALIKAEGIVPFTDYKPDTPTAFAQHFLSQISANNPIFITVYKDGNHYVMSDDYNAYYMYLQIKADSIPCLVLCDKPTGKYVLQSSEARHDYNEMMGGVQTLEEPIKN